MAQYVIMAQFDSEAEVVRGPYQTETEALKILDTLLNEIKTPMILWVEKGE